MRKELTRHIREDTGRLSEASRRHYLSKLDTLVRRYGGDGPSSLVAVINDAPRVIPRLQSDADRRGRGAHAQTVHAYCSSVLALLDRIPRHETQEAGILPSARDAWASCSRAASRATRRKYVNHLASDRQREGYVPWEELVRRRQRLEEEEGTPPSRARLLLSMLTMAPPMRTSDLGSLRVLRVPEDLPALPTSVRDVERSAVLSRGNHLVLPSLPKKTAPAVLVMTEYKTAERYARAGKRKQRREAEEKKDDFVAPFAQDRVLDGPRDEDEAKRRNRKEEDEEATRVRIGYLSDALTAVVRDSLAAHSREWLFEGEGGRPFVLENSFNQMALRELRWLFDGRPVTVNLVRHAAVAWLDRQKPRNRELELYFQYWMMHTRDMQREYLLLRNLASDDFR